MSRITVPICAIHAVEMKASHNGRMVMTTFNGGKPYEVWAGDEYQCPVGGEQVVVNFGSLPVWAHHTGEKLRAFSEVVVVNE